MSRIAPEEAAEIQALQRSRFITYVYCVMALGAVCASFGVREWGGSLGLAEDSAQSISKGFAATAVFNLVALSAIEFLHRILRNRAG